MQNYPIIRPPQIQKKEGVQNLKYPDILESSFISLIVGKPGSGKTHLIEQMLTQDDFYKKKFDRVLVISPSGIGNLQLQEDRWCKNINIQWLNNKINELQKEQGLNVLIILDDVIAELNKLISSPYLLSLFTNRRHIIINGTISYMITTQKYNMCPLKIRNNITNVIFFSINNKEWQIIKQELFYINDKDCELILKQTYNDRQKHDFIYIRLNPYKIHINFKPFM